MKKKTIKKFVFNTETEFKSALDSIVLNNFELDILAERENATITVKYNEDKTGMTKALAGAFASKGVTVKDIITLEAISGDFGDWICQNDLVQNELDKMTKQRDVYCNWWEDTRKELGRVKMQIQSIAVLMDSIFPRDNNGAQE